jgi:RIO-like serine/threonine protein kinase
MGKQNEARKLAIKDELLGKFRAVGVRAGALIPTGWLYDEFLPSLSNKEEQAMEETVAELIKEGLITYESGAKPTYRLTQKGAETLC